MCVLTHADNICRPSATEKSMRHLFPKQTFRHQVTGTEKRQNTHSALEHVHVSGSRELEIVWHQGEGIVVGQLFVANPSGTNTRGASPFQFFKRCSFVSKSTGLPPPTTEHCNKQHFVRKTWPLSHGMCSISLICSNSKTFLGDAIFFLPFVVKRRQQKKSNSHLSRSDA